MTNAEVIKLGTLGGLQVSKVESATTPTFNMLVYGEPGVGKTVLAGSASVVPELSPVLVLDVEGGTLSLRKRYPNVDRVSIRSAAQLTDVFRAVSQGEGGYRTLVLDSITEMQKYGMYGIMRAAVEKDDTRDPDLPGIGEWGKNTEQVRKIIRAFRDLPVNSIFTALAKTDKDNKGRTHIKPSLSGKLADEIAGFLDIVGYMYLREVDEVQTRVLCTVATEEIIAKDRTDLLPPVLASPSMETIYNLTMKDATNE